MKKILIIGASVLQLPAIKKAKEKGFYVGVADYNPRAVGIPYADEFFNVSTIDVDGVVAVAQRFQPDGIMTLATDMPMRSIAAACKACGLPGIDFETAVRATDKGEMIKAFKAHGVEHPWFYIVEDAKAFACVKELVTFPCILKPTDNAGSRGVVLVQTMEELDAAYSYAHEESRGGAVIVEEYLRGPEFSVEVMVVNGEPHVLQVTDKLTTGAPHFVEMGHNQPSRQTPENVARIKDLACRAVRAIGIQAGPAHVELILTDKGPRMVELGARMGGDCITTHLVPLSTGIDMVGATIDIACGQEPDITPRYNKGAAIRYFKTAAGTLARVDGISEAEQIPGVQEINVVKAIGDQITEIGSSVDRVGFVIAQADTAEAAIAVCEEALNRIDVVIDAE